VDSTAPRRGVGEFAIEELFDTFGGNCEEVGVEDDKGGVGPEVGGDFGRPGAAGVVNEKLAAEAANESGGLREGGLGKEQKETEETEKADGTSSG
jgi:hypothetical protein